MAEKQKAREWTYSAKNLNDGRIIQGKVSMGSPVEEADVELYVKGLIARNNSTQNRGKSRRDQVKSRFVNFKFTPIESKEEVNPVVILIEPQEPTKEGNTIPFTLTIKNEQTKETYCQITFEDGKSDEDNELAATQLAGLIKKARVVNL